MASQPFGHTVSRVGSKAHDAALVMGKVKAVVEAARWAYPYVRAGVGAAAALL